MPLGPAQHKARILVVDDEEPQMNALCDTLRVHAAEIAGFTSAAAALEALRSRRFDLLLTDLMMPEMDGIDLLRAAQQIDPDLIAIIMTGAGTIASAVDAMKAGALDYILKPFKLSVILPVLSRALAVQRLRLENAELQQRVSERTRELETANKELEAFSHSVSHDLRTPLGAVRGFAEILQLEHGPRMLPEAQGFVKEIIEGADRMEQLINDLLRFSKLGRQTLDRKNVDVDGLVRDLLNDMRSQQGQRHIDVRIGELPDCYGDLSLLRQVFVNLLSNAFKYTRHRQTATVAVGCEQRDGERVYFVRDNGAGFDMRYAQNLFGVFQRLHDADQFEGTGVGLSIVQRIVQRHGGRIWAEAEVDRGAVFFFTLPAPEVGRTTGADTPSNAAGFTSGG